MRLLVAVCEGRLLPVLLPPPCDVVVFVGDVVGEVGVGLVVDEGVEVGGV